MKKEREKWKCFILWGKGRENLEIDQEAVSSSVETTFPSSCYRLDCYSQANLSTYCTFPISSSASVPADQLESNLFIKRSENSINLKKTIHLHKTKNFGLNSWFI